MSTREHAGAHDEGFDIDLGQQASSAASDDLERHLSPASTMRKAWKMAAPGARKGDFDAKRRANFAWRQLNLNGGSRKRQRYIAHLPAYSDGLLGASHTDMESLVPVRPEEEKLPCFLQRASRAKAGGHAFWPVAMTSICLGAAVVVPYISFLRRDPGGVLFFSFVVHVMIVLMHLPAAGALIRRRQIPIPFHAAMAIFWCLFTTLKSDAFVRMPTSLCVLLSNMRMMVGMVVQVCLFGKRFSRSQVLGAAIATAGIATAGSAMQQASAPAKSSGPSISVSFLIGLAEMLGSSLCLSLHSSTIKVVFSKYGECVEEQVFVTHLVALLVVFPSQWDKVGPRITKMAATLDWGLLLNLTAGVLFNVVSRRAGARLAGRAPNLLMAQLVQTVDGFVQLLLASLLNAPPYPPTGFWSGAAGLLLGTLQYLRASDAPPDGSSPSHSPSGSEDEAPLAPVDKFGSPLQAAWASATAAAKHQGVGSTVAARQENRAWRKMRMEERALQLSRDYPGQ